jgi:hypothetical protein
MHTICVQLGGFLWKLPFSISGVGWQRFFVLSTAMRQSRSFIAADREPFSFQPNLQAKSGVPYPAFRPLACGRITVG